MEISTILFLLKWFLFACMVLFGFFVVNSTSELGVKYGISEPLDASAEKNRKLLLRSLGINSILFFIAATIFHYIKYRSKNFVIPFTVGVAQFIAVAFLYMVCTAFWREKIPVSKNE